MTVSALSAARFLCERSNWDLTNLKLQKMLYLAHMVYFGRSGEPLVDGHFEAWDYGPVHPDVYRATRVYGADPVGNVFRHARPIADGTPEAEILQEAINELGELRAATLVAMTHSDDSAWSMYYDPGMRGVVIPNHAILEEYRSKMRPDDE